MKQHVCNINNMIVMFHIAPTITNTSASKRKYSMLNMD